ncbi:MAG TPA: agmatine deiminase family protein [Bryobacteraceae bacterium]|nr:agmatine deiminase family protein [Bryobacteraceae bacterium]
MSALPRFRMPAEWEPHKATWLAWPHERTDWPGKFEPIPHLYAEIVRILSRHELVNILVPLKGRAAVRALLKKAGAWNDSVNLFEVETNRSWTRDFLPTWVLGPDHTKVAVKWHFNGWAKYKNWRADDDAGHRAAKLAKTPDVFPDFSGRRVVLEGGSIDVNGAGSLLTTEECLLSDMQQRNPGLERGQIEALLDGWLGASNVIWLNRGIAGDDTHGHVDDIARFVSRNTVVATYEQDHAETNYAPLRENYDILRQAKDERGVSLKVVQLPMPKPVYYDDQRLPASYANFYIANEVVLVPTFHDPNDRAALNILARLFPGREVIGIHAVDLVLGLGTLHCMTMQEPL